MSQTFLLQTPLHTEHQQLGARFVPFSGWEMPVSYSSLIKEHNAVRTQVGMFDISHMGKFLLRGSDVRDQLSRLLPSDLSSLQPGESQYSVLLNSAAGILDDIILYFLGQDPHQPDQEVWLLIVNAATTPKDWQWLQDHLQGIELQDQSRELVLLAVQGPKALATLQPLLGDSISGMKRFQQHYVTLQPEVTPLLDLEELIFVARTGYTGEDGFELMLSPATGVWLWQHLLQMGVTPCGLGCRDSLRLEASMHLYGQDMDESTTPLEAGLSWLIASPVSYIGCEALQKQRAEGLSRRLIGLRMQGREIARAGYSVFAEGKAVGRITSGTHSPTLTAAIALAYVPTAYAATGTPLEVEIRGKLYPAKVVKRPFYRSPSPAPR
ncbi:MAG: glycine cleavage system aminomethyltransferase GcvT [Synechococcaceae cyanobacterium SM2_3_1]|nr:glycine cleavage system aminomethyltransferase GcvT [Synechococcaceae cyanobacterium SM2_3_1]